MPEVVENDAELKEICDLAQEGLCIQEKWGGECPYYGQDAVEPKCGLCVARYITEKLGYHK